MLRGSFLLLSSANLSFKSFDNTVFLSKKHENIFNGHGSKKTLSLSVSDRFYDSKFYI